MGVHAGRVARRSTRRSCHRHAQSWDVLCRATSQCSPVQQGFLLHQPCEPTCRSGPDIDLEGLMSGVLDRLCLEFCQSRTDGLTGPAEVEPSVATARERPS